MKTMIVWLGAAMVLLAGSAPAQTTLPQFQVDPLWPKPLPNNWILGQVSGIATDRFDRIWVVHRPGSLTPASVPPSRTRRRPNAASPHRRCWCSTSPAI